MDYRAIAELIWFSFLGVSVFALVTGFSVRLFLAPVIREVLTALGRDRSQEQARLAARLELVEHRLESVESEIRHVGATEEFYRKLGDGPGEADAAGSRPPAREADAGDRAG